MLTAVLVSTPALMGATPPRVTCTVRAPAVVAAGAAVPLTLTLRNGSATALAILSWGTPFEDGWFAPFVHIERDGHAVPFAGAMIKRGDPEADEYVRLAPHQRRQATLDMALAFAMQQPGRYRVRPAITLHDVVALPATLPRPRAQHTPLALTCAPVTVVVRGSRAPG